ncbi:putative bifunctional diguanylate cyclase/phosphodiesterase [Pseudorhodoplanes sp.]|uniref:putative bifunctional diguanylate cyclase/phosphodiesterase n=1 Tax=Pseudorhodoplanes sp. TaxID=1934341 RepID=UPI00391B858F
MAESNARFAENGAQASWDRARLSIVLPISVIVAVAILSVVVAVFTSAKRADEVSLEHEKRLLSRAIANHGEQLLRELESVTGNEEATRRIRDQFDRDWVHNRVGLWLKQHFDHDFVLVSDGSDTLTYALLGRDSIDPRWLNAIVPELAPTIDYVRGRSGDEPKGAIRISEPRRATDTGHPTRATLIQRFLGRPAAVAATLVAPTEQVAGPEARANGPLVMAVKFVDESLLAEIAGRLQLTGLRLTEKELAPPGQYSHELSDSGGHTIMSLTWTPKRPGSEIVTNVIPFIAVAFAGFALLAALIYGYMRRTAAAIAQGEQRLRYLALHDPLCGLPNRNYFGERLEQVIAEVQKGSPSAAVFYIDLDHFKDVNDTLGHPVGDELIRNVTARLSSLLRPQDLVSRLGGDEFAVIMTGGADAAMLQRTAERIIQSICAPYTIGGHNILIGASIGIATIDQKSEVEAADVMRYADMALYRAKNEGRNRACIYDAAMDADLSERKLIERDLRDAIAADQLRLVYQPIVNASGDTIVAVEALSRWSHPARGDIEPSRFIPIAEHSGLIIGLGEWVMRRACSEGKSWPGITVSVNVSPLQFRRPDFVETVERILTETEFDPSCLEIELTESTLLGNVESAEVAMHRLKALGLRLALDDFGTGYSSLAYLRRFPFDKLKIDKSFVRSIERSPDAAAIVHAIVGLGRGLGMKVTAEGVETAEQQLFLRAAGVHSMQGYRFGRPGSPTLIATRLAIPAAHRSIARDAAAALAG